MNFKKPAFIFFCIYLAIGLFIFKDYGVNYDETDCQMIGVKSWDYVIKHDLSIFHQLSTYHGPAMEMLLVGMQKALQIHDSRHIILERHLVMFLLFYLSVIAFYASAKTIFDDEKWALVASLMLVLSPRIFGDSFFNTKDIAFLSFIILSFYSLLRLIKYPGFGNLLFHCVLTAFAIDIRIMGVILIPVVLGMLFREFIIRPERRKKLVILAAFYPLLVLGFIVLFWPVLWEHPRYQFIQAFLQSKKYNLWPSQLLYTGRYMYGSQLPWHYLPLWILISTPVLFSVYWLFGVFSLLKNLFLRPLSYFRENFVWLPVSFLCVAPVVAVIFLHSVVYNAWRHVFFIYPFFVLVATYGLKRTVEMFPGFTGKATMAVTYAYFMILCALSVYLHPYQNLYFNFPALAYFKPVETKFETDYWGLSYKQGLEYISGTKFNGTPLKIVCENDPGYDTRLILTKEEARKLEFIDSVNDANYYIADNNYIVKPDYFIKENGDTIVPLKNKVYEIRRLGFPILDIYGK